MYYRWLSVKVLLQFLCTNKTSARIIGLHMYVVCVSVHLASKLLKRETTWKSVPGDSLTLGMEMGTFSHRSPIYSVTSCWHNMVGAKETGRPATGGQPRTRAQVRASSASVTACSILSLPDEVPADFVIWKKGHLPHLERSSVKIGSITVSQSMSVRESLYLGERLANPLQRLLGGKKVDKAYLTSISVQPPLFFKKANRFSEWLPFLHRLRKLELTVQLDNLESLLAALPIGLEDFKLTTSVDDITELALGGLSKLKNLQSLELKVAPVLRLEKTMLWEHRDKLFALLHASRTLLGLPEVDKGPHLRSSSRVLTNDKAVLSDVDGGSGKAEKQQTEGSLANFCATPRAAKIAELTAEAIGNAEFSRLITRGQGPATTDCLHLALQALQWHLALAMAMDADEPEEKDRTNRLQQLWNAADIGQLWVDLRPLPRLAHLSIHGLCSVWLPLSLQTLQADTWGYTGPLPSGLTKYVAKMRASSSMAYWELRPLGLLPLTELEVAVSCSEEQRSREFCFQVLQGTHSLQLHSNLQHLRLVTDRGLHIDAEISHHLLTLLAQKKQLRSVEVGSGCYRLRGDHSFGSGVAALNLLSDLKDHCGWHIEHRPSLQKRGATAVTTCTPPTQGSWLFLLGDEQPDFVSDFQ